MSTATDQLIRGTIRTIHADRGYGFVNRHDVDRDVFFHANDCLTQFGLFVEGEVVTFQMGNDKRTGKPRAVGVCKVAT